MNETVTYFDTYVNGVKVVSSTKTTLTLENDIIIDKSKCRWISADLAAGAAYYRYDDKEVFSAFMLDPMHGWVATHRLPLESAIHYCKEYRKQHGDCPVALVPNRADPEPYLQLVALRVGSRYIHTL